MLHLDIPCASELRLLANHRHPASVSLVLPTCKAEGEVSGDRIAFGNLAREATDLLATSGIDKRTVAALSDLLEELKGDDDFWRFQANSLVVFATPEAIHTFRVPNALSPLVTVSDRFHLKPLLRAVSFPNAGFLLALAIGGARLFEILPEAGLSEVRVADMPKSAADEAGVASLSVSTQSRRSDGSEAQRMRLASYCRAVDRAVREVLAGRDLPLFLAADTTIGAIYRSLNNYPHLAASGSESSPEDRTHQELGETARALLDRFNSEELASLIASFSGLANVGRATADVAQAARAATIGAVDTLMVDMDLVLPGTVDEATGAVEFSEPDKASGYGVTDEIARRTLLAGGRVIAVRAADLPPGAPLAALLRYAV